jgi:hypothetical protein
LQPAPARRLPKQRLFAAETPDAIGGESHQKAHAFLRSRPPLENRAEAVSREKKQFALLPLLLLMVTSLLSVTGLLFYVQ